MSAHSSYRRFSGVQEAADAHLETRHEQNLMLTVTEAQQMEHHLSTNSLSINVSDFCLRFLQFLN